ncbi:MAG: endo,4-beta-glucanase [Cyanobacteriota bacterium]
MTLANAAPLAAVGSTDRWQEQFFAPYVDMGLYPVPDLDGLAKKYGVGLFSLGFMQASPSGKLAWAGLDALSLDSSHEQAVAILGEISALRAAGGDVMVSLGGAAGQSLAQAYAQRGLGVQALATAYGEMVDTLKLSKLDFDIEGAALAETQTIKLQMEAVALLQQTHPGLGVWLTLPVLPQGLTQDGLNTVKAALLAGVQVDGVNVMAMDYGDSAAPPQLQSMGAYAIDAATTTFAQLTNLFASQGKSFGWNQLGVTPMLGVNDITSEVFTIQDAEQLEVFARENGLGMLSMWSINRDNPGAAGQVSNNHAGLPAIAAGGFSSVWGDYGSDPVISPVPPVVTPPVVTPPVVTPPVVGNGGLSVEVGGSRWWGGFTAELKITNSSGKDLQSWSYTFDSPHSISGAPWGATVISTALGNGISRYTLSGAGWAAALKAGASVSVGFNGSQGSSIGNDGALTAAQLISSSPSPVLPTPPVVTPPVVPVMPVGPVLPTPPVVGNGGLSVAVGGSRWWGGFTAELKITNSSGKDLQSWSYTFDSPHSISGAPWGATVTSTALGNGISRYTLSGAGWAAALKAGASVNVGFNGSQGSSIGTDGALTAAQLFSSSPSPVLPTPPVVTPPVTPLDNGPGAGSGTGYAEALQKSFLFYEANRSGDLDGATNRVPWRGDSGLNDGRDGVYFGDRNAANLQLGLSLDLTGGYHDAGDHGKFGMPLASTISSLAWGGIAFKQGYNATGQLDELLAAVKWGTDYLLKAHGTDASGNTSFFVAQVGDGAADHALWSAPENQTIARPAMAVTAQKPGSDVTAGSAAALASASILFRENGSIAYADELLRHAESLYRFADTYRGKYSDSITEVQGYYNSWSGYEDELSYGAAWLARAKEAAGGDGSAYRQKALQLYNTEIGGLSNGWTQNWDDSSYGAAVLLAEDTGNAKIRSDVEGWLNSWVNGSNGVQITAGGLRFISQWGSLRYAANTAMLAGVYADSVTDPNGAYSQLATDTIDYILGDNPRNSSYEVGYGINSPQQPHHRAASGVGWDGFRNGLPNENILYGALVGGPSQANDFAYTDVRSDYIGNEVAIDYNSGFTGALAFAAQRRAGF